MADLRGEHHGQLVGHLAGFHRRRSCSPSPSGRPKNRLVATYDHDLTQPEYAKGYRWNIVLTGSKATRMEQEGDYR
jgi:hypothetical protein